MLKRFLFFLCFWGIFSIQSAIITNIRTGQSKPDTVRVVWHLNKKADYNVFVLSNPTRIVVDINNSELKNEIPNIDKIDFISDIRVGYPNNQTLRFVFEPTTEITYKQPFFLSPGADCPDYRLVFDITETGKKTTPIKKSTYTPPAKPIIVLDPGHGGADPGAISVRGKYEKNLTLQMAKELKDELDKTGKYTTYLTRSDDRFIKLRNRIKIAHKYNADLFISIHADSAKNKKATGLSVYTISDRASDKEAQLLAESENKADILVGMDLSDETPEVSNILIDLAKTDTMDKSSKLANYMVEDISKKIKTRSRAHRYAGFAVLKSPSVPSVLLEMGYLSNKDEEKQLHKKDYRAKLISATIKGINRYFDSID